jgi:hypothetical protein
MNDERGSLSVVRCPNLSVVRCPLSISYNSVLSFTTDNWPRTTDDVVFYNGQLATDHGHT